MHQLVNRLAGSPIRINPAGPDTAKQKEELTRTTKCQDEGVSLGYGDYKPAAPFVNAAR
jgi:hypothetical protein